MREKESRGKKKNVMRAAVTCLLLLLLSACSFDSRQKDVEYISEKYAVPDKKQLIIYTSHKEEVYLPIIREFENRTGIWVEVHSGGTAQMMQEAKAASETGSADIMFGGGIETYQAHEDIFFPYKTSENDSLDKNDVSEEGYWTAFTELPIVFIYNNKLVSSREAPKMWEELFDSRWKGKIAFADPNNSGTSYTILSTMQQLFNEEKESLVPRFYEQLDGKVLSSSGQIIPEVSDGSYLVGITLEETAKKYIALGYNISMVYPEDGTSAVPDGCAIIKNAPHSYNAGLFLDFVVGYDTQEFAMENFCRRPVRMDIPLSSEYGYVRIIPFDIKKSAAEETAVIELWDNLSREKED